MRPLKLVPVLVLFACGDGPTEPRASRSADLDSPVVAADVTAVNLLDDPWVLSLRASLDGRTASVMFEATGSELSEPGGEELVQPGERSIDVDEPTLDGEFDSEDAPIVAALRFVFDHGVTNREGDDPVERKVDETHQD